jgi:hypothetical protein
MHKMRLDAALAQAVLGPPRLPLGNMLGKPGAGAEAGGTRQCRPPRQRQGLEPRAGLNDSVNLAAPARVEAGPAHFEPHP